MTPEEIAKKLTAMGKKGYCPNHQDNRLLMEAGQTIRTLIGQLADAVERAYLVEERCRIQLEDALGPDPDAFPPPEADAPFDAAAPGEAAEDFWDDDWPLDPGT